LGTTAPPVEGWDMVLSGTDGNKAIHDDHRDAFPVGFKVGLEWVQPCGLIDGHASFGL